MHNLVIWMFRIFSMGFESFLSPPKNCKCFESSDPEPRFLNTLTGDRCPYDGCDFAAYKLTQIDNHVNKVHKRVKPFACQTEGCKFSALDRTMLRAHVQNVHENRRNYPCGQCKHRSKSKKALDDHVNAVHLKVSDGSFSPQVQLLKKLLILYVRQSTMVDPNRAVK